MSDKRIRPELDGGPLWGQILGGLACAIIVVGLVSGMIWILGHAPYASGAQHDARVQATKQALIAECSQRGMYPVLDPNYATAVYCSAVPVATR